MTTVRVGVVRRNQVTTPGRDTTVVTRDDTVTAVRNPGRQVSVQQLIVPVDRTGMPISGGLTYYSYNPQAVWSFTHPLGRTPKVAVYSLNGELIEGEVQTTDSTVTVSFNMPVSGYVILS